MAARHIMEIDALRKTNLREFAIRAEMWLNEKPRKDVEPKYPAESEGADFANDARVTGVIFSWAGVVKDTPKKRVEFARRRQRFIDVEEARRMKYRSFSLALGFLLLVGSGAAQAVISLWFPKNIGASGAPLS